ncbi:4131_t:CDS:2 [Funneliformis mosseae]|uniref:4131_t:CDS:1 n=1 Tax=Funneliformis mosseae TaxID=27381 RepID=A0A9N8ZY70_FUNMO|nr:4131_t:CDS:2 [Funneliformis mosseae]
MSYSKTNGSILLSDLNHSSTNLSRSPPNREDSPTNPLKRSVKDMNDGIQEVDENSPKPKKPAIQYDFDNLTKHKFTNNKCKVKEGEYNYMKENQNIDRNVGT